jgi:hypothetical protein
VELAAKIWCFQICKNYAALMRGALEGVGETTLVWCSSTKARRMQKPRQSFVIAIGEWLYDGLVLQTVRVVEENFDYMHELDVMDGVDYEDMGPFLNEHGLTYCLIHSATGRGNLFAHPEAARENMEGIVGKIDWKDAGREPWVDEFHPGLVSAAKI